MPATPPDDRSGIGRRAAKLVPWVLALAVTGLVVPAATKQWSDRGEERRIKDEMGSAIDSGSQRAFSAALRTAQTAGGDVAAQTAAVDAWVGETRGAIDVRHAVLLRRDCSARQVG